MIARVWSARAMRIRAPQYAEYLRNHVLPGLRTLEGYMSGQLLEREAAGEIELVVVTWWRSLESIRAFAGDDLERAVVTADAATLLTDFDKRVRHYGVVVDDTQDA